MGRYKYDRFKGRFSDETIKAIISDLKGTADFNEEDYDWTLLDIRVKRANKAQRHRFADTIRKLEEYMNNNPENEFEFNEDGIFSNHLITVREFSKITGRNRKTVEDWMRKKLISYIDRGRSYYRLIDIEKAIEELKKNISHQQL
ncbi:hypothetical protein [uncultured Alistipes sp.]|uniref:hypothetical protein n=1 Tax=uncultured Alistipes sp. TaxID=538949 RepID=UPI0026255BA9|nr:hypothetical protein [uncultured Alistipes sp.]